MLLQHPFAAITPTLDGAVLEVLARADAEFTGGQLHRMIPGASESGVRKAAKRLVEQGLVLAEQTGPAYRFRLNRDHLLAPAVIDIAHANAQLHTKVRDHVATWPTPPDAVVLFGSAARGQMTAASDLDVLVVAEPNDLLDEAAGQLAQTLTALTGNDTRIVHMTADEIRDAFERGDNFMTRVVADAQMLYGPPRFLHRLRTEARQARV